MCQWCSVMRVNIFLNHPVHMLRMEECHTLAQRTSGKNTDKFTT